MLYGGTLLCPWNPLVTRTSVLGLKFDGGVVMAADVLGSYGSLACFPNVSPIVRVNNSWVLLETTLISNV